MPRALVLLFIACAPTHALTKDICTQGDLTRTVSIVYAQPGQAVPCEVLYEKLPEGSAATLWRAINEEGYCEARAAEFVEKLKGLGFTCMRKTMRSQPNEDA